MQAFAKVFLFELIDGPILTKFLNGLIDFFAKFDFLLVDKGVGRNAFVAQINQLICELMLRSIFLSNIVLVG